MKIVPVRLGDRSYEIRIARNAIDSMLATLPSLEEVAIVTDTHITATPWFPALEQAVRKISRRFVLAVMPAGEPAKHLGTLGDLASQLARAKLSRKAVILALGGGVVGDVAGFLAASYLRGVRLVQIPTTLLACVDSSIGGKTGVNLPEGKNLFGAFYQPEAVFIDPTFLETLNPREYAAGMAEILKHGLIRDAAYWKSLRLATPPPIEDVILRSVEIKAEVVIADEKETKDIRSLLNFGHTLGHAIEQVTQYEVWLHGEAVALGMLAAARISQKLAGFPAESVREMEETFERYQLPTRLGQLYFPNLLEAIQRDKKSTGSKIRWVLLREIGQAFMSNDVTDEILAEAVEAGR